MKAILSRSPRENCDTHQDTQVELNITDPITYGKSSQQKKTLASNPRSLLNEGRGGKKQANGRREKREDGGWDTTGQKIKN